MSKKPEAQPTLVQRFYRLLIDVARAAMMEGFRRGRAGQSGMRFCTCGCPLDPPTGPGGVWVCSCQEWCGCRGQCYCDA